MTTPTRQDDSRQFDELERLSLESQALKIANSVPETTAGTPSTTFQLTGLACDTRGPFRAVFSGSTVSSSASTITFTINGATTNIERRGSYGNSGSAPTLYGAASSPAASINGSGGASGARWGLEIESWDVSSGRPRVLHVLIWGQINPTTNSIEVSDWIVTWKSNDEITAIGVSSSVAGDIASTSTAQLDRL